MSCDKDQIDAIWEIVDRSYGSRRGVFKSLGLPPFDLEKENLHNSKSDFLAETAAVETALVQAGGLTEYLLLALRKVDRDETLAQITNHVDDWAREQPFDGNLGVVTHLIVKNAMDTKFSMMLLYMLSQYALGLKDRKRELENQRALFWTAKSRSPDHYARAIALRFAQWAARHTGKRPTFGTSREGGHPSTQFGRALEEIFVVLEISTKPKLPAIWAIEQITDEDISGGAIGAMVKNVLEGDERSSS